MQDNRGDIGQVQKGDIDEAIKLQSGEGIFHLLLQCASRLETIILLKTRTEQNSTYAQAASLEANIKDRRITRNMGKNIKTPKRNNRSLNKKKSVPKKKVGNKVKKSLSKVLKKYTKK